MTKHSAVTEGQIALSVKKAIAEQLCLEDEEIKNDASWEDLGADFLDIDEILLALEKEFDCNISEEEEEKISTVGQIIEVILKVAGSSPTNRTNIGESSNGRTFGSGPDNRGSSPRSPAKISSC